MQFRGVASVWRCAYLLIDMGDHSLKTDLWNGLRGKCPACGKGHMFRAFLKVADRCDA